MPKSDIFQFTSPKHYCNKQLLLFRYPEYWTGATCQPVNPQHPRLQLTTPLPKLHVRDPSLQDQGPTLQAKKQMEIIYQKARQSRLGSTMMLEYPARKMLIHLPLPTAGQRWTPLLAGIPLVLLAVMQKTIHIYIYIYIYLNINIYIYIYIYRERERLIYIKSICLRNLDYQQKSLTNK